MNPSGEPLDSLGVLKQQLEIERRRRRQMEVLNAITRLALSSPDADTMLQALADCLGELFEADSAYLTQWDDEQQNVISGAAYGADWEKFSPIKIKPTQKSLTREVLDTLSPLVVEDLMNTAYVDPELDTLFPSGSLMALPLMAEGHKLGVAVVAFSGPHLFTPEEISLGDEAASQIAVVLLHLKLIETERRRSAQLAALHSVSRTVVSSLNLDQIMASVVNLLHETFGYSLVSIYLHKDDVLQMGAQVGYEVQAIFREIPIMQGVMGRAVRTKQVQFIRDVLADPNFISVSPDIASEICVPMIKEDTVFGILNVEETSRRILTEEDVNLLKTFANQVAVAIDNARLFQAEHGQRKLAEALFAATRDFTANLSEAEVLNAIVTHLASVLGGIGCTISRWDPDKDCVVTLLDYAISGQVVLDEPGEIYQLEDYPVTRAVIESRQPVYLRMDDPAIDSAERAYMKKHGCETLLMLPIGTGQTGQIYGIIEIYGMIDNPPHSESDIELVQNLVAQAAAAIQNARLYSTVQSLSIIDELTGLYNRRGLFELGRRETERAARFNHPLAALFLDLDHFKNFNDLYSYAVGDQALHLLAHNLKSNLREIDIAGRYGGEEFIVLLPQTDQAAACLVAERLRRFVEKTKVKTGQEEVNITVSIGVAVKTPDMHSLEDLIDRAGHALHKAKAAGRNCVAVS